MPLATDLAVQVLTDVVAAENVGLVTIDTAARAMVGIEENSATQVGECVARSDRFRETTHAAVVLVHHSGKVVGARGSNAWLGAVDLEALAERDQTSATVEFTATRATVEPSPARFKIAPVDLFSWKPNMALQYVGDQIGGIDRQTVMKPGMPERAAGP